MRWNGEEGMLVVQRDALLHSTAQVEVSVEAQKNVSKWERNQENDVVSTRYSLSKVYLVAKRVFDVVSSLLLFLVIWPVFLIIAVAIKIDSEGPVFFKHNRIGQYGKSICIFKFRTMKLKAEEMIKDFTPEQMKEWKEYYKLENDPRLTRLGKFLRRFSLDELPQIFDILRGHLSVVGPRPVIADELEKYGENKDRFLSVKPGLTGYWQAFVRNSCDYEQRMEMELFYVDRACVTLDMRILLATVGAVLTGRGAK